MDSLNNPYQINKENINVSRKVIERDKLKKHIRPNFDLSIIYLFVIGRHGDIAQW